MSVHLSLECCRQWLAFNKQHAESSLSPHAALLFKRSLQDEQHDAVLFAPQLFLDRDQRLQIQNPDAHPITDVHFDGVRKQILVAQTPADGSKQIQRTTDPADRGA